MTTKLDHYLDMTDEQIDNLINNLNLNNNLEIDFKKLDIKKKSCKSCKSEKLVKDNIKGYLVCTECAVINQEFLDENPEFTYDEENNGNGSSRYGCPANYFFPKSALGTKIAPPKKGYNKVIALQRQGQMPYREKSLLEVLERIQLKCKKYSITQTIIDSAKILYKKVSDSKHIRGKRKGKNMIMRCINRRSMIAACVFYACKMQKEPRSPKEIADIYDLEIKHVHRGCRKILDYIDLNSTFYQIRNSQAADFIERLSKKMDIDKKYIEIAKDICNNIHKLDIASTHEPPSIAAGCILLVANTYNINISKKQISEIFDISDVTISKTYRKIHPYYKIILNNKVTDLILQKKNAMINPDKNEISEKNLVLKEQLKKELLEDIKEDDSEIESDSDSDTDTYNNEEIESFTNKETESFTNKETESFTNKETESFTNKETESFNNKETEIETETEIEIEKPIKKINNKKKKNLEI
jgi:transcription initiation factor TFIIIB Brf1 subunit/transcription initiation factor TFIIB